MYRKTKPMRNIAHLLFGYSKLGKRAPYAVFSEGLDSGAVILQVIGIGPIYNKVYPFFLCFSAKMSSKLRSAIVAPHAVIFYKFGVVKFAVLDNAVVNAYFVCNSFCCSQLFAGKSFVICSNGHCSCAKCLCRSQRHYCTVNSA